MIGNALNRDRPMFVETTFVLFFLSLDFGHNQSIVTLEGLFMAIIIALVAILPFTLPSAGRSSLFSWLAARSLIVSLGLLLGLLVASAGVLPDLVRFVPLTLAFPAALYACVAMFHNVFKLDFAD